MTTPRKPRKVQGSLESHEHTAGDKSADVDADDAMHFVRQLGRALAVPSDTKPEVLTTLIGEVARLLGGIKPAPGIETMLALQMVATHQAALDCLRRGMTSDSIHGAQLFMNFANRFMNQFVQQLDALNKHRGKGQQKIIVERIQVAPGASAIVGNVRGSAPVHSGEGQNAKPAMEYAPGPILDLTGKDHVAAQKR